MDVYLCPKALRITFYVRVYLLAIVIVHIDSLSQPTLRYPLWLPSMEVCWLCWDSKTVRCLFSVVCLTVYPPPSAGRVEVAWAHTTEHMIVGFYDATHKVVVVRHTSHLLSACATSVLLNWQDHFSKMSAPQRPGYDVQFGNICTRS